MSNQDQLVAAFAKSLGIEASRVTDELTYNTIAEWDSIAHMQLVTELENEFDVMLPTSDILALSSPAKAKEILAKHGVEF
jgi:acyl carrier protein